jgi:hypothetical protein
MAEAGMAWAFEEIFAIFTNYYLIIGKDTQNCPDCQESKLNGIFQTGHNGEQGYLFPLSGVGIIGQRKGVVPVQKVVHPHMQGLSKGIILHHKKWDIRYIGLSLKDM